MGATPAISRNLFLATRRGLSSPSTTAAIAIGLFRITKRWFSSPSTAVVSQHSDHQRNHKFLEPNTYIGSWEAPVDPKEAQKKLALLRREYGKQVKGLRKEYIKEVELMRLEKLRTEEARKEAIRAANEERMKLKAEAAKVRAEERKIHEEELRRTLLEERAQKLEYWRMKERLMGEKKKENNELLHRQSSRWIDEKELGKQILNAITDSQSL